MNRTKIYDHLLVTLGCRAGVMDMRGDIDLPIGTYGEDDLAEFAARTVDDYMTTDGDTPFDEYIETALLAKYGKENRSIHSKSRPEGAKH